VVVLIIDEDPLFREKAARALIRHFTDQDVETLTARTGARGISLLERRHADVVLLDEELPDGKGVDWCARVRAVAGHAKIILAVSHADPFHPSDAKKAGVHSLIAKPMDIGALVFTVEKAMETLALERTRDVYGHWRARQSRRTRLLGESAPFRQALGLAREASAGKAPVLLVGEAGTGKTAMGRAIHQEGSPVSAPYLELDCAALPPICLEEELFGSGELGPRLEGLPRRGAFELAHGGTLFLKNIGSLPRPVQERLPEILESGCARGAGGTAQRPAKARLLASVLEEARGAVVDGLFPNEGAFEIRLPPLRERAEDIPELARWFLHEAAPERALSVPPEEEQGLLEHAWPGNLRELRRVMEISAERSRGETVFPLALAGLSGRKEGAGARKAEILPLVLLEREAIVRAMAALGHNQSRAARALGVSRSTLARKLKEHGLAGEDRDRSG
jgi:DNA-binding NtrC family response regulator